MNKCRSSGEQNANLYPTAYLFVIMRPWADILIFHPLNLVRQVSFADPWVRVLAYDQCHTYLLLYT